MLLSLDHLTVYYGRRPALEDLNLKIESKALGLLGPNGAGKSTLIRTLLGLIPFRSGSAALEDLDIRRQGKRIRELIGYMPEHEAYLAGMTVVRYLRMMGEMCGLEPRAAMERAHEVLFYVGLGEVRYRQMEGFSFGMQQKVRLAQALIHGPRILILDEPTNGLDPTARDEMLNLIRDMVAHSDSKLIISSHLLKDIETCCQEVMVLKKGRIVAAGNIEAMKQTTENLYDLKVKGDADRLMAELAARGCECRLGAREMLEVITPDGMHPRAIFEIAQQFKIQIRHFYARKDSLEEIFLKALEEENGTRPNGEKGKGPAGADPGRIVPPPFPGKK